MMDGVQGSIGYSLRWFRDNFGGLEQEASEILNKKISDFQILDLEASQTRPGAGGIVYIPYLFGKFHPILNPKAQAGFFGLSPNTTRSHLARAVMEGCCFDMYENFKTLLDIGLKPNEVIVTGGPSKGNTWCQALADVSNTIFKTVIAPEASPFGDAILAGVGSGLFKSFDDVAENAVRVDRVFIPNEKNHRMYEDLFGLYKEIYQSLIKSYDKLSDIRVKHGL
jgi:xylulokinase